MVVLYIKCVGCNSNVCNSIHFQHNFINWTSGNNEIDKFIQSTQLSDHNYHGCQALEWIPYYKFYDIRYITIGEFSNMYMANWIDGCISHWNYNDWKRDKPNMFVVLKILTNPESITSEFINKV
jgi:hypothetical protein